MHKTLTVDATAKRLAGERRHFIAKFAGFFYEETYGYKIPMVLLKNVFVFEYADKTTLRNKSLVFEQIAVRAGKTIKDANISIGSLVEFDATIVNTGLYIPIWQLHRILNVELLQGD